jgi:DNA-nicking Smr family endonuclease
MKDWIGFLSHNICGIERRHMLNGFLEIDVHGMTRTQALTAIDAVLRRTNGSAYRLQVIHGFHGGTVLRDAIRAHYRNHPKVIRIELGLNPGETDLILKEL